MSEGEVSRHSSQSNPRDALNHTHRVVHKCGRLLRQINDGPVVNPQGAIAPPASKIFLNVNENKSRYRKLSSFVCVGRLLCRIAVSKVLRTC